MSEAFAPDLMRGAVAVVTGGGTGIGFACARLLHALGARLALLGRRTEVVEKAAHTLDAKGETTLGVRCDIREPDLVQAAVAQVRERFGRIDVLINNAGGQFPAPAETISTRGFEAVVRNNLTGTWNITREVATAALLPQKSGAIVNVIANVERGFPGMMHTGAARAGVDNMTKTLAIEWVSHGVRVNAVAPGIIASDAFARYPEALKAHAQRMTSMKRCGTPEEVALAVVFLASPAATFITGVTLYVDGGARLWGETWPIA